MKFGELFQPRAMPTLGAGIGLPVVLLGLLGESDWHKAWGLAGAALIAVGHLAKLATDLNGLGRYARERNAQQDAQLADHEAKFVDHELRLKALEGKR